VILCQPRRTREWSTLSSMGKRDHDSTMDLSLSQLVVPKPPKAPPPGMAQNDVSVWGQLVVGTADFAPAPKKRATHAPLWIGLVDVHRHARDRR